MVEDEENNPLPDLLNSIAEYFRQRGCAPVALEMCVECIQRL